MTSTWRPCSSTHDADAAPSIGASLIRTPKLAASASSSAFRPASTWSATVALWLSSSFFIAAGIGTPYGIMSSARARQWVTTTCAA